LLSRKFLLWMGFGLLGSLWTAFPNQAGAFVVPPLTARVQDTADLLQPAAIADLTKQLAEGEARRDQDPEVLGDALVALGHLNDDRAIPVAVSLIGHSSAKVRRGVVMALSRHDDEAAIGGLIQLSCDSDDDIREWATFGLGMLIDTDTDGIRAALLVRLTDDHPDVRVEAIAGLARRGSKSRP
jgi:HEAT repeat protein